MNTRITASLLGPFLLLMLISGASAQVQRAFVSGGGSDSNACSRTAPCRTFSQAISQTNAGGEVYVLDSAGYGPFTVTKSITINAPQGVIAGISVFSGDGIDINAGAKDIVTLRGLTVNNQGSSGYGVVFNTGFRMHMENCVINGFSSIGGGGGGTSVLAGGAQVEVVDTTIKGNDTGVVVQPLLLSGTALATIDHVRLEANFFGLVAGEGSQVTVTNSVAANNIVGLDAFSKMNVESTVVSDNEVGISAVAQGTGAVQVNVARCVISDNSQDGISAKSLFTGVPTVRLSSSTVTGNGTGLNNLFSPGLSFILSRGDNTVEGNTINTQGTIGSYAAK